MKHQRTLLLIGLTLLLVCLFALDVWAGPGGKIAKAVFTTFWGKILLSFCCFPSFCTRRYGSILKPAAR
jgi:hypothetical protein